MLAAEAAEAVDVEAEAEAVDVEAEGVAASVEAVIAEEVAASAEAVIEEEACLAAAVPEVIAPQAEASEVEVDRKAALIELLPACQDPSLPAVLDPAHRLHLSTDRPPAPQEQDRHPVPLAGLPVAERFPVRHHAAVGLVALDAGPGVVLEQHSPAA